jgi:hypothetical protein
MSDESASSNSTGGVAVTGYVHQAAGADHPDVLHLHIAVGEGAKNSLGRRVDHVEVGVGLPNLVMWIPRTQTSSAAMSLNLPGVRNRTRSLRFLLRPSPCRR